MFRPPERISRVVAASALSFSLVGILIAAQSQHPAPSPATANSQDAARQKKKLHASSSFAQYAGRDASNRLIAGAATRDVDNPAAPSYDEGLKDYGAGRYRAASEAFRRATELAPEWADAHYALGVAHSALGEHEEAAQRFGRALGLTKKDDLRLWAYYGMGNAYAEAGEFEKAVEAYERAILLRPELSKPHYNLALVRLGLGEEQKAADEFKEAVRINPKYAEAHYNLGVLYHAAGNKAAAAAQRRLLRSLDAGLADKLGALIDK
jgi:tetratricopeptide (TPR) repeat protein